MVVYTQILEGVIMNLSKIEYLFEKGFVEKIEDIYNYGFIELCWEI